MKKLLCILTAICILAMTMGSVVMAEDTNLSLGEGVEITASTTHTGSAANVADDSVDTYWFAKNNPQSYVTIELPEIAIVSKIVANTNASTAAVCIGYSLTGEDGSWTNTEGVSQLNLNGKLVKFVRVWFNNNSYQKVNELQIFGEYAKLAYLSSITPEFGSLTPEFNAGTTSYEIQVADFENLPTLTPTKFYEAAEVSEIPATESNNYTATFTVTYGDDTTTYTVKFVEINYAMQSGVVVTQEGYRTDYGSKDNVINGRTDDAGWWCNGTSGIDKWVQIKLAQPISVTKIAAYSAISSNDNWSVAYSLDGETWTTPSVNAVQEGSIYSKTLSLDGAVAQYVRVNVAKDKGYLSVKEIEVYGKATKLPFLSELNPSSGILTPAFDMNTSDYKLQIEDFENLPTLTYTKYIQDGVEPQYTPATAPDYTATIVVEHEGETKTYTIQYVKMNWAKNSTIYENVGGSTSYGASADKTIDGDLSTGFLANPSSEERYVTIKLPKPIAIDNIDFYTGNGSRDNYSVWYSLTGEADSYVQGPEKIINDASPFHWTSALNGAVAQYVRVKVDAASWLWVYEIEVYGKAVTETYTTSYTLAENVLTGNVTFFNKTENAENDKYYLMAVYVDDVLYNVIPANKAANSVAAGAVAGTKLISTTLPAGEVTAKVFVWNNPAELVPVTTAPLTLK